MPKVADVFGLAKTQSELDFVNVALETDAWLFIDPFAIGQRQDAFSRSCHATVLSFFQEIVDSIRRGDDVKASRLLQHLREPNETRLGLSRNKPKGAGLGTHQAMQLMAALKHSSAVRTGFLSSLEECELMIEGIGPDKISDLTTNVIRGQLIEYTNRQCELHNMPTRSVAVAPRFDTARMEWISDYARLPVWEEKPILLVPKIFVRLKPAYNHQHYYRQFVLDFLQAEELNARTSLVKALKKGRLGVLKKDVEAKYPCTKQFLYEFSREHPEVLRHYRERLEQIELEGTDNVVETDDEVLIAATLALALQNIAGGSNTASEYHRLMIGAVEFIFFPHLFNPVKEKEIHEGRKRIDILMENGARRGIFHRLHDVRKLFCPFVPFECKNYTTDIRNPELDQLAGRFSTNRGQLGFLCCRRFEDRSLFIRRCKDTFADGRGLIVPFDDQTILELLYFIEGGRRSLIDERVAALVDEIWN